MYPVQQNETNPTQQENIHEKRKQELSPETTNDQIPTNYINIIPSPYMSPGVFQLSTDSAIDELYGILPLPRHDRKLYWRSVKLGKKILRKSSIAELSHEHDPRPYATVTINGMDLKGLLDSGATISCLGTDAGHTLARLNLKPRTLRSSIRTASGHGQEVTGFVDAPVRYAGITKLLRLYIIPTLAQTLYLGIDFWRLFGLVPRNVDEIATEISSETADPNRHELSSEERKRLREIQELFPCCTKNGLGKTGRLQHVIDTGDTLPIKQRHYPISPAVQDKMYAELDRMLQLGVIEESQSPWNSPVSLLYKASTGKVRLVLDARALNNVTIKDAYPMPNIEGILSRLDQTYYISSIDLKDAFWQVELATNSREKTAFSVPGRPHYQFTRMPFGLCNSAQSMCRLMDQVIPSHLRDHIFVYIDDLLVVSTDLDTHLERLRAVAENLRDANLTINVSKSKFLMKSIRYLGHIVGGGTIRADPGRVSAIVDYPAPATTRQIRSFLGLAGWYQRYIANYSTIVSPITDLLRGKGRFSWTTEAQEAFDELKTMMTTAPVLRHPDFSRPFTIQCDASQVGIGSVLFQNDDEGNEHPIAFMSKKLNAAQRNYSVTELECLAAVTAIKRFRGYVEGMKFKVITDHASLKWLMSQRDLTGRLARWSLKLQGFEFEIEHRRGTANVVPDALSRAYIDEVADIPAPNFNVDLNDKAFESDEYRALLQTIEENEERLLDVKIDDGKAYKRVAGSADLCQEDSCWRIWIPENMRNSLLEQAHKPPLAAHGGTGKTLDRVKRFAYWPTLSHDVRYFVANCDTCKETKAPNTTLRPPMGRPIVAERPFQRLYTDLLGPYPRSKKGHVQILVVLDQFSKFPLLQPMKKATAKEIVEYIEKQVFHVFGVPESVYSDNGVQYKSKEFGALLKKYGVRHITAATHTPQANASERVNRSVLSAIRSYIDEDQSRWDEQLSAIGGALRCSTHSSIKYSPYYALFGYHMSQHGTTFELLRKLKAIQTDIDVVPTHDFRELIHADVSENLRQAHDIHEKTYNFRSRPVEYLPGQEVFRRNFRISDFAKAYNAKLGRQWLKSRVTKKLGTAMYLLEDQNGKPITLPYHAKDLRR